MKNLVFFPGNNNDMVEDMTKEQGFFFETGKTSDLAQTFPFSFSRNIGILT